MNINATLFVEMVVFISFVGLTRRYVWPPIIEIIDARQAEVNKGIEDARLASEKLALAEDEAEKILKKARTEYARLIDQAEHTVTEMLEDARSEADALKEDHIQAAQDQVKHQICKERNALQKHTLSFVGNVLKKVIVKLPDQPQLDSMIDQAMEEVDAQN